MIRGIKVATQNTVIVFYFIWVYYFKSLVWNQYLQMNTRQDLNFDRQGVCTDLESCLRPNAKVCLKSLSRAHYFPLYSSINYSTPIVWKDFRGLCFDLNLCLLNLVQDHSTSLLRVFVK